MTKRDEKTPSEVSDDDLDQAAGAGEKAHTRVWGDPHVNEKDGTTWNRKRQQMFGMINGIIKK